MKLNRREILKLISSAQAMGLNGKLLASTGLGLLSGANALIGQGNKKKRFIQIFLEGGWDMALATDPAIGGKAASSNFDQTYWDNTYYNYVANNASFSDFQPSFTVGGSINPLLEVGYGLKECVTPSFERDLTDLSTDGALRRVPAAFINGMFVEVTAHELAVAYMLSGTLSLSRSREYAAFVARLGAAAGGFPSHVVLGNNIPLDDTKIYPPLQASDTNLFQMMLAGPKFLDSSVSVDFVSSDAAMQAADNTIAKLNQNFQASLHDSSKESLTTWNNSESQITSFFSNNFQNDVNINDENVRNRYGLTKVVDGGSTTWHYNSTSSIDARFATAFLIAKSGLSPYITLMQGGYDTHQNHTSTHIPVMQTLSRCLNRFVYDLQQTDDPLNSGDKLIDNTTILISSEFNRTPLFNNASGTDHWMTGSAILLGDGVKANTVFGSTDDTGKALDTGGSTVITSSSQANVLLPDHLAGAILRKFNLSTEAEEISNVDITANIFNS